MDFGGIRTRNLKKLAAKYFSTNRNLNRQKRPRILFTENFRTQINGINRANVLRSHSNIVAIFPNPAAFPMDIFLQNSYLGFKTLPIYHLFIFPCFAVDFALEVSACWLENTAGKCGWKIRLENTACQ